MTQNTSGVNYNTKNDGTDTALFSCHLHQRTEMSNILPYQSELSKHIEAA